ncbi:MAG: response regulator transcription factor [Planctomycetota bacterium]
MSKHDRILVVEDDDRIRSELRTALASAGYRVGEARDLAEAREKFRLGWGLLLLDLGLPDGDGLELCRELRAAGDDVPIVVATARDANDQRIRGLDAGADDYVVKPFDVAVLLARLRSVLRRARGEVVVRRAEVRDLWVDVESRRAGRGETEFEFTPLEFDLLAFLVRNPGRAWSRDRILAEVWGLQGGAGGTRTVDIHVRRLRSKIEDDPASPTFISTVWGVGYRLDDGSGDGADDGTAEGAGSDEP